MSYDTSDYLTPGHIPRCEHGNIILACPDDDCEQQNNYLIDHYDMLEKYIESGTQEAKNLVRAYYRERLDEVVEKAKRIVGTEARLN